MLETQQFSQHQSNLNNTPLTNKDYQAIAITKQSTSQIFYDYLVSRYQDQFNQAEKSYWIANQAVIDGDYAITPVYDFQLPEVDFNSPNVTQPQAIDLHANVNIKPTAVKKVKTKWWNRILNKNQSNQVQPSHYGWSAIKPIGWIELDPNRDLFVNPLVAKVNWLNWKESQMMDNISKTFAKQNIKAQYALEFSFDYYDLDQEKLLKREKFIVALSNEADIAYFSWSTINGLEQLENHIVCPHPQAWFQDLQIYFHNLCNEVINKVYLSQNQYEMHRDLINNTIAYLGNYLWPQGQISFTSNDLMHRYFSKILNINTFSEWFTNRMAGAEVFAKNKAWLFQQLIEVFNFDHYLEWLKDQIWTHLHDKINQILNSQHYQNHLDGTKSDHQLHPDASKLTQSISQALKFDKISEHANIYYQLLTTITIQWNNLLAVKPPQFDH